MWLWHAVHIFAPFNPAVPLLSRKSHHSRTVCRPFSSWLKNPSFIENKVVALVIFAYIIPPTQGRREIENIAFLRCFGSPKNADFTQIHTYIWHSSELIHSCSSVCSNGMRTECYYAQKPSHVTFVSQRDQYLRVCYAENTRVRCERRGNFIHLLLCADRIQSSVGLLAQR